MEEVGKRGETARVEKALEDTKIHCCLKEVSIKKKKSKLKSG